MSEAPDAASPPSDRATVRRLGERGAYDRATIDAILDEALICHVGFVHDGTPVVIPTIHARRGDTLYVHGSVASRMLRSIKGGAPVCVTVTLVDGIVLARSHFHSSMNYRSVMVFGEAREVTDADEKLVAFEAVVEHVARGRWDDGRAPTDAEARQTTIVAVPLDEASAKVRTGPPGDDEEDYALPLWGGVVPLRMVADAGIPDERVHPGVATPSYVVDYRRP